MSDLIGLIHARLAAALADRFALIERAAGLLALDGQLPTVPALYVYMGEEGGSANSRANGVRQDVECDVICLIVTSQLADRTGGAASVEVETLKAAVRDCLIGYQPGDQSRPITLGGGALIRARQGQIWWEYQFTTSYMIEA
ncbi:MAG: hypothetical protein JNM13_15760 [Hyphomicrobiaceae bacterium]|nr:hypothetical protein [Hyphomicrobiaceae bacterium]